MMTGYCRTSIRKAENVLLPLPRWRYVNMVLFMLLPSLVLSNHHRLWNEDQAGFHIHVACQGVCLAAHASSPLSSRLVHSCLRQYSFYNSEDLVKHNTDGQNGLCPILLLVFKLGSATTRQFKQRLIIRALRFVVSNLRFSCMVIPSSRHV